MDDNNAGEIKIPQTITPDGVWLWNSVLFISLWVLLLFPIGFLWSSVFTGIIIGALVWSGVIAIEGVDFHGFLLFNPLNKKRRVIFPGLHIKLPWERLEKGSERSLLRMVASEGSENLPTSDPAENMVIDLTVHQRVNVSGTPEQASENFIKFHSIPEESLKQVTRKEILRKFSKEYAEREMEELLDANKIEEEVEADPDLKAKIQEMQNRWGMSLGFILGSSHPDDATKAMKRTPAMAEALATAMDKLKKHVKDPDERRRMAMILDPNTDYSEKRSDINLNVDAPHLQNMTHLSVLGGLGTDDEKKGGKK